MEEAYGNLNAAYLQIKGMVVIEGFYALVAGFVITTFVFKLVGIIKEMINEGKGFNAKHFYELGREYIFCIGLICIMPVLLGTLETVLAYGADEIHVSGGKLVVKVRGSGLELRSMNASQLLITGVITAVEL